MMNYDQISLEECYLCKSKLTHEEADHYWACDKKVCEKCNFIIYVNKTKIISILFNITKNIWLEIHKNENSYDLDLIDEDDRILNHIMKSGTIEDIDFSNPQIFIDVINKIKTYLIFI